MSEDKLLWDKGLRCGNCIHYFCDEFDGDQCENDNDMMAIKCNEFESWYDEKQKLISKCLEGWYELDNELTLEGKVRVMRDKIEIYEEMLEKRLEGLSKGDSKPPETKDCTIQSLEENVIDLKERLEYQEKVLLEFRKFMDTLASYFARKYEKDIALDIRKHISRILKKPNSESDSLIKDLRFRPKTIKEASKNAGSKK